MNSTLYLHTFAIIAIIGLSLFLTKAFWLPVMIVAGLCLMASYLKPKR